MAVRTPRQFETRGNPLLLQFSPSVDELRASGAEQTAEIVARATELRDRAREAEREVRAAEEALRQAQQRDRAEAARAVVETPDKKLSPKHGERAQRALDEAQLRHAGLVDATEVAATELLAAGETESEKLIAAAHAARKRAVEEVARAAAQVTASVDALERAVSIARWSEAPDSRRWKVGLRRYPVGKRHGGTPVGQVLEMLDLLPDVLAAVQTPGEEPEEAKVFWGWSGLGRETPPPGSASS